MTAATHTLQLLLLTFSGWVSRHQQDVIEYLVEENRVLNEQMKGRALRLNDDQRRRLAALGKRLGRRVLGSIATIVTPDTILRWHHRLIAAKWTYAQKRVGRPGVMKGIRRLVVRMALDNSNWGYRRIQGALKNLGHRVAKSTIAKILKEHGIRPAPDRPTSWRTFLKAHWEQFAGADFFTTEVWTPRGLVTYYVLFVIDLRTRKVHVAGATPNPGEGFMTQVVRNLTDVFDGFLRGHRFLICDRDNKFTDKFKDILKDEGVDVITTPYQAPNCNAHAERFVRTIKEECLERMILLGESSLRRALRGFVEHYHLERNHQGIGNELIEGTPSIDGGEVQRRERLGGLLSYYERAA